MRITIGLAQIYPKLGDLQHNLAIHLDYAARARAQGVDLLVFPELSLTGYQVQDLVPEVGAAGGRGKCRRIRPAAGKPAATSTSL